MRRIDVRILPDENGQWSVRSAALDRERTIQVQDNDGKPDLQIDRNGQPSWWSAHTGDDRADFLLDVLLDSADRETLFAKGAAAVNLALELDPFLEAIPWELVHAAKHPGKRTDIQIVKENGSWFVRSTALKYDRKIQVQLAPNGEIDLKVDREDKPTLWSRAQISDVDRAEFLFDLLIAPADRSNLLGPDPERLLLEIEAQEALAALPWHLVQEFMLGSFRLAGRGFVLTRQVPSAILPPNQFDRPMRILFVSGSPLDDPAVRAGTEFYAAVRSCIHANLPFETRLLVHATREELAQTVTAFRPHILHFAGHGIAGKIELRQDPDTIDEPWCSADEILADFGNFRPQIFMLSACNTASAPVSTTEASSFAVQLVKGKVPVVVAMSARITDFTARLFTRGLMQALAKKKPFLESVAAARGAAMAKEFASKTAEWSYLGVFHASSVPADYAPTAGEPNDRERLLEARLGKLAEVDKFEPVLCQREDIWEYYVKIVGSGPTRTLLLRGGMDTGKSRMIRELKRQAIREGHLAITLPTTLDDLAPKEWWSRVAYAMRDALATVAKEFGVPWKSTLLTKLIRSELAESDFGPGYETDFQAYEDHGKVPSRRLLGRAFESDIRALEALIKGNGSLAPSALPIVFVDELELLPSEFVDVLFDFRYDALTLRGWSSDANPIPFVAAISTDGPTKIEADSISTTGKAIAVRDLVPFRVGDDADMMCYEQVLLHPFHEVGSGIHEMEDKVFAFAPGLVEAGKFVQPSSMKYACWAFRTALGGKPPTILLSTLLYEAAMAAVEMQKMVFSDEYVQLRKLGWYGDAN